MEVESLSLLGYPEHIGANAVQIIIIRMSDR